MKRLLQTSVFLLCIMSLVTFAKDDKKPGENNNGMTLQKKSAWAEPGAYVAPGGNPGPEDSGFPRPFNEFTQYQNTTIPAISTGYYFYDTEEGRIDATKLEDIWKPEIKVPDTNYQQNLWTKIVSGPRMRSKSWWTDKENTDGKYYFRNPADMLSQDIYTSNAKNLDTTDNAIAGPIPIGIKGGFFFNGLRYDSFYVSTNGVIALTNRRYVYGSDGNKAIPAGADNCYDPNSMDWFVGGTTYTNYPEGTRMRRDVNGALYGDANGDGVADNTGMMDIIQDDFGYRSAVLGCDPLKYYETGTGNPMFTTDAGIRANGPGNNLSTFTSAKYASTLCKPALISPFWGSLQISQYNPEKAENDRFGGVYYKRTITNDSLVIAFFGVTFKGTVSDVPYNTMSYGTDARADNTAGFCDWDSKIILDRKDSSVVMIYERLSGRTSRGALCGDAIRANTTSGLLGWGRHVNYNSKNPNSEVKVGAYSYPWAGEYMQFTHYFSKYIFIAYQYPSSGASVRFKQWKNTLRVANINYLVRNTDPATLKDPSYDFTVQVAAEDYELLAGEPLIGAIQPRVLVQNLTNEIQGRNGVNFVEQDFQFWARFRIRNLITDSYIYNRAVPVSKYCLSLDGNWDSCYGGSPYIRVRLCNDVQPDTKLGYKVNSVFSGADFEARGYDGVPAYRFVQVDFDPFVPNEFTDNHIGRLRAYVIAEPKDIKNRENIGDQWPFDDTTSTRLFVMKRLKSFQDDVTEFHVDVETQRILPSVLKWVTLDGVAIDGDGISKHALPPRGKFIRNMPGEAKPNPGAASLISPVINLNRLKATGTSENDSHTPVKSVMTEWGKQANKLKGDEIRSYPINLLGKHGSVFSISVQRDVKSQAEFFQNYPRAWGEDNIKGPEGKTFVNGSPFNVPRPNGLGIPMLYPGAAGCADMLAVEFAKPSDDGVNDICNIEEANWRHLPYRRGTDLEALTDMAALTIYGAGGYLRGFLESDPDSTLTWPNNEKQLYNSLRPDFYDTGHDWEFQKYATGIPDTFINWQSQGAKNFRFRVRVLAMNHQVNPMIPTEPDDADNYYIDNVNILFPDEITDIEMNSVRIQWPYQVVPPSQATSVPIYVKVANGTSKSASLFGIKVKIFNGDDWDSENKKLTPDSKPIYCRMETVPNLQAGEALEYLMPAWNVRQHLESFEQSFVIFANIVNLYGDLIPSNDTTFFEVDFQTAPVYSYDPNDDNALNGVSDVAPGFGMSTPGSSNSQNVSAEDQAGRGIANDGYSGKIASKFEVFNTDLFTGYQAYFGSFNSGADMIEFMLYKGNAQKPSTEVVPGTRMIARRGAVNGQYYFNQYIPYFLDAPVELSAGIYWVSISQLSTEPLCLGGSAARTRMKITDFYQSVDDNKWGAKGKHIFLDRNLRVLRNEHWESDNYFAYMNTIPKNIADENNKWVQMTPAMGNLGYPYTDHRGVCLDDGKNTNLYLNSSWIPMLRPTFTTSKSMTAGSAIGTYEECPSDTIPVELVGFKGNATAKGIELTWETASETNNAGFEVQRRIYGNDTWAQIAFVDGSGNSVSHKYYNLTDKAVQHSNTYQYRLRQLDKDGTSNCSTSDIVTVKYEMSGNFVLSQNSPNPVENVTNIGFNVPYTENVKIEIVNLFGNVVAELANGSFNAGTHNLSWDARAKDGSLVPAGAYIYRMVAGDEIIVKKMTVVR